MPEWRCIYPWVSFQVMNVAGDVYPCCWSHTSFGNIYSTPLNEIWNSESAARFRRDIFRGYYHRHCRSSCPKLIARVEHPGADILRTASAAGGAVSENARTAARAARAGAEVVGHTPSYIRVFPTNACGMRCSMCCTWSTHPKKDIGVPAQILPYLPTAAVLEAVGGEPLLSHSWLRFLHGVTHTLQRLKFRMITNGIAVPAALDRISFPPPSRWHWIGFSLDAMSESVLTKIRRGVRADQLLDAFTHLVTWSAGKCPVMLLTVVMRPNITEVERIVDWLSARFSGHGNVSISLSLIHGNWPGFSDFTPKELLQVQDVCTKIRGRHHAVLNADVVQWLAQQTLQRSNPMTTSHHAHALPQCPTPEA